MHSCSSFAPFPRLARGGPHNIRSLSSDAETECRGASFGSDHCSRRPFCLCQREAPAASRGASRGRRVFGRPFITPIDWGGGARSMRRRRTKARFIGSDSGPGVPTMTTTRFRLLFSQTEFSIACKHSPRGRGGRCLALPRARFALGANIALDKRPGSCLCMLWRGG